ncbi:MAG TPA: hypothetical protein PKN09_00890 [Novosphingobium sp.]|nr:hypothetical protein [Novosphingobium sp.]
MTALIALVLAASAPQADAPSVPQGGGAQASARATVEILRAETSDPDGGEGATARQVRRRSPAIISVEFE